MAHKIGHAIDDDDAPPKNPPLAALIVGTCRPPFRLIPCGRRHRDRLSNKGAPFCDARPEIWPAGFCPSRLLSNTRTQSILACMCNYAHPLWHGKGSGTITRRRVKRGASSPPTSRKKVTASPPRLTRVWRSKRARRNSPEAVDQASRPFSLAPSHRVVATWTVHIRFRSHGEQMPGVEAYVRRRAWLGPSALVRAGGRYEEGSIARRYRWRAWAGAGGEFGGGCSGWRRSAADRARVVG
jgi:hypothetical protein